MGQLKKILISIVIVFVIGVCFIVGNFGSALFQEGNPIPLIVSATKLKFSGSEYVQFAKTEKRNRYLSLNTGNNHYDVVKEFMDEKGWKYQEQMGSGLIFTKNGEDAVVEVKQYSSHYFIWEIQKAFFN